MREAGAISVTHVCDHVFGVKEESSVKSFLQNRSNADKFTSRNLLAGTLLINMQREECLSLVNIRAMFQKVA